MTGPIPSCLTEKPGGIARCLQSKVKISSAFTPNPQNPQLTQIHFNSAKEYQAIWDTGATGTCITQKVQQECHLVESGVVENHTAGGTELRPTCLISLYLPNHVYFHSLRAVEVANIAGADILIGMDVISTGDLIITNFNNETILTFRIPSRCSVDFLKTPLFGIEPQQPIHKTFTLGRNDPCSCGSGKKFKNCCINKAA